MVVDGEVELRTEVWPSERPHLVLILVPLAILHGFIRTELADKLQIEILNIVNITKYISLIAHMHSHDTAGGHSNRDSLDEQR